MQFSTLRISTQTSFTLGLTTQPLISLLLNPPESLPVISHVLAFSLIVGFMALPPSLGKTRHVLDFGTAFVCRNTLAFASLPADKNRPSLLSIS